MIERRARSQRSDDYGRRLARALPMPKKEEEKMELKSTTSSNGLDVEKWNPIPCTHFYCSPTIGKIGAALAKAQGDMLPLYKDSDNPFFHSRYADLAACVAASRKALTDNGIAVYQGSDLIYDDDKGIDWGSAIVRKALKDNNVDPDKLVGMPQFIYKVSTHSILIHTSGEWLRSDLTVVPKDGTPQGVGSAMTYSRRYLLCAQAGLAPEDDDGEAAQGRGNDRGGSKTPPRASGRSGGSKAPSGGSSASKAKDPGKPASEAQLGKLFAMGNAVSATPDEMKELMFLTVEKSSSKELTMGDIQTVFKKLDGYKKDHEAMLDDLGQMAAKYAADGGTVPF